MAGADFTVLRLKANDRLIFMLFVPFYMLDRSAQTDFTPRDVILENFKDFGLMMTTLSGVTYTIGEIELIYRL